MRPVRLPWALCAAAVVSAAASVKAGAQTCTTPSSGTATTRKCTVAVSSGTWTVQKLGTLALSSNADVSIPSPDGSTYDGTKAEAAGLARTATIKANAPWQLTVAPNSAASCVWGACWTGTDLAAYTPYLHAEQDKPAHEFLIGTTFDAAGNGYSALPDANAPGGSTVLLSNQAPTAGQVVTLYWAEMWWYVFDGPGTYSIPFFVTLTLP